MKSKSYRTFIDEEGNKCRFNFTGFYSAIESFRNVNNSNSKKITITEVYTIISDNLNISPEAVRNWRRGYNGPADIDIIKNLSVVLKCDYHTLLDTQIFDNTPIIAENKSIVMDVGNTEQDVLMSLLKDLIEIVDDFSNKAFPGAFGEADDEAEKYYSQWIFRISQKMKKNSFYITKSNYKKLETLYLETRGFLEFTDQEPLRWTKICPFLAIFTRDIAFHEIKNYETLEDLIFETQPDSMVDQIVNEIHPYAGYAAMWDSPVFVLSMMMGSWYLEIIRHDFPELFVD